MRAGALHGARRREGRGGAPPPRRPGGRRERRRAAATAAGGEKREEARRRAPGETIDEAVRRGARRSSLVARLEHGDALLGGLVPLGRRVTLGGRLRARDGARATRGGAIHICIYIHPTFSPREAAAHPRVAFHATTSVVSRASHQAFRRRTAPPRFVVLHATKRVAFRRRTDLLERGVLLAQQRGERLAWARAAHARDRVLSERRGGFKARSNSRRPPPRTPSSRRARYRGEERASLSSLRPLRRRGEERTP